MNLSEKSFWDFQVKDYQKEVEFALSHGPQKLKKVGILFILNSLKSTLIKTSTKE